ncbi:lysozyme inhibitor LprI family protein [Pseudomonas sp. R2.Fl]|nr:lysozyme inhibitor LprI family protein [Pseudomonas sp. R2.Fl]
MKSLAVLALCGCVLLIDGPASGEDEPKVDCENAQTQTDMNICAGLDYEEADKALNAQWPLTRKAMVEWDKQLGDAQTEPGAEKALLKAQRAWLDYRDGQCEAQGFSVRGGSMEPLVVSSCLAELTRKRTEELKAMADGFEQ